MTGPTDLAQPFQCDRCARQYTSAPIIVSVAHHQQTWWLCDGCYAEVFRWADWRPRGAAIRPPAPSRN